MSRLLSLLTALLLALPSAASELRIIDPWVREAPPGATVLAGYLRIENPGAEPRRLLWASSDAFGHSMLHRSVIADGKARMVDVKALEIPAGGSVALEPGSYHLMLMQPARPLRAGDAVPLLLCFDNNEHIELTVPVKRH